MTCREPCCRRLLCLVPVLLIISATCLSADEVEFQVRLGDCNSVFYFSREAIDASSVVFTKKGFRLMEGIIDPGELELLDSGELKRELKRVVKGISPPREAFQLVSSTGADVVAEAHASSELTLPSEFEGSDAHSESAESSLTYDDCRGFTAGCGSGELLETFELEVKLLHEKKEKIIRVPEFNTGSAVKGIQDWLEKAYINFSSPINIFLNGNPASPLLETQENTYWLVGYLEHIYYQYQRSGRLQAFASDEGSANIFVPELFPDTVFKILDAIEKGPDNFIFRVEFTHSLYPAMKELIIYVGTTYTGKSKVVNSIQVYYGFDPRNYVKEEALEWVKKCDLKKAFSSHISSPKKLLIATYSRNIEKKTRPRPEPESDNPSGSSGRTEERHPERRFDPKGDPGGHFVSGNGGNGDSDGNNGSQASGYYAAGMAQNTLQMLEWFNLLYELNRWILTSETKPLTALVKARLILQGVRALWNGCSYCR